MLWKPNRIGVGGVQEVGEDKAAGESPKRVGSGWKRGSYTTMLD